MSMDGTHLGVMGPYNDLQYVNLKHVAMCYNLTILVFELRLDQLDIGIALSLCLYAHIVRHLRGLGMCVNERIG